MPRIFRINQIMSGDMFQHARLIPEPCSDKYFPQVLDRFEV
jgi:hypothetical protein